jgi:hypothetical protein
LNKIIIGQVDLYDNDVKQSKASVEPVQESGGVLTTIVSGMSCVVISLIVMYCIFVLLTLFVYKSYRKGMTFTWDWLVAPVSLFHFFVAILQSFF